MSDERPFWLERASDLLAEPDPGPTPFAVEGLLVAGSIGAIQGSPKVGKTWLVLELALAITTGRPAFGRFAVPEAGPVIVVLEESGRAALHRRLTALARAYDIRPEEVPDLGFSANRRVRLNDPEWQERLLDAGREIRPRAIFFDPLARMKGSTVDENAQREIGPVLDFMRDLRDASGSAVVFVHHSGHDGGRLRGSSDLEAYWESKLSASRDDDGIVTLTADHREAESSEPFRYRLNADPVTETVRLAPVTPPQTISAPPCDLAAEIEDYLRQQPDEIALTPDIAKAVGKQRLTVEAILEQDGRFLRTPPPPGRSSRAKPWTLATRLVQIPGTSRDEYVPKPSSPDSSDFPTTPVGGGGRDEWADGSRHASPDESPTEVETTDAREGRR